VDRLEQILNGYRTQLSYTQQELAEEDLRVAFEAEQSTLQYHALTNRLNALELAQEAHDAIDLQNLQRYDAKHGTNLYGQSIATRRLAESAFFQGYQSAMQPGTSQRRS
jgi:hypothetical protein